jgi:uncharacterized protein YqeY
MADPRRLNAPAPGGRGAAMAVMKAKYTGQMDLAAASATVKKLLGG